MFPSLQAERLAELEEQREEEEREEEAASNPMLVSLPLAWLLEEEHSPSPLPLLSSHLLSPSSPLSLLVHRH